MQTFFHVDISLAIYRSMFCNIHVTAPLAGSLFNKVGGLQHRCFPNFAKFLRTAFSQKSSGRLLLNIHSPNKLFCLLKIAIVWEDLRLHHIENKVNLAFCCYRKSQMRVLNTGLKKLASKNGYSKFEHLLYFMLHIQTKETFVKRPMHYDVFNR